MEAIIKEMVRVAEQTSARMNEEYVSLNLHVTRLNGNTSIKFQGYTPAGSHTDEKNTLEEGEAGIIPDRNKMAEKLQQLRNEAAEIERLIAEREKARVS